MSKTNYSKVALTAVALTLVVIVLGAWVRLTDAGLGCPDWPGCYGELTWPKSEDQVLAANTRWAERPVETGKAIREMVHRYVAGILVLLVSYLTISAWRRRRSDPSHPVILPSVILGWILFQAALGMWTVTLLLKPAIVLAHLGGGMLTLALLFWLHLKTRPQQSKPSLPERSLKWPVRIGLVVIVAQLMMGGWVSTNYAALACPDFPTCMGQWWPEGDYEEGFKLWRGVGVDYEGGVLDQSARIAIHMAHRVGAVVVVVFFTWLLWRLYAVRSLVRSAQVLTALLATQITLGILNVVLGLPLTIAVAHNGVAALLVMAMVYLGYRTNNQAMGAGA
ncbi:MAG TPA: COX15/CtaA family protein [Wenzhouxiangella sp.]